MRNKSNFSFKGNLLKSSANPPRLGSDIKGSNMKFSDHKFNAPKFSLKNDSENGSFERFSNQFDDRDEQFNQNSFSKFQKNPSFNKVSLTKRKTDHEQKVKNRRFFLEDGKGLYKDKDISDYSEEYLSSSSSFDNDDVKSVLGNKVENAVYEIYGKNIPRSAIKELKESITFVLKEQADQLPKYSDDEYTDQETEYSGYRSEYSGSEYSDMEDDYQYDYEYDQIKENESENFKLEKLQIIQEKRMRMMQEQQYQIQVFQYGFPLDKKPIRIYQKKDGKASTTKKSSNQNKSEQAVLSEKNSQKKSKHKRKTTTTNQPAPELSTEKKIKIEDFNKLSLKSQQEKIQEVIDSNINLGFKSKLKDLNILIEYLMKLGNISETKNYLTIERGNNQYLNQWTNGICLCYDMTQLLYENKLLNSQDLIDLLSKFNYFVEIKYPSDDFKEIYKILNSHNIKLNAVISGISKTDKTFMKNKNLISVTIESSVNMIDQYSFQGCSSLKNVTIPSSVKIIGSNAFCECRSLREINIPDSVISIGEFAFCDCGLSKIVIPSSIKIINVATFRECGSLSQVTIPSSVINIENYAFFLCGSLENVDIPSSVTSIGESSFEGCPFSTMVPRSLIKTSSKKNSSKWKSSTNTQWMPITKARNPDNGWTGPNQNSTDMSDQSVRNIWGRPSGNNNEFLPGYGTNKPNSAASSVWLSNSKSDGNEKKTSKTDSSTTENAPSNSTPDPIWISSQKQPSSNQSSSSTKLGSNSNQSPDSNESTGWQSLSPNQAPSWGQPDSNQTSISELPGTKQGPMWGLANSDENSGWGPSSDSNQLPGWGPSKLNQANAWPSSSNPKFNRGNPNLSKMNTWGNQNSSFNQWGNF